MITVLGGQKGGCGKSTIAVNLAVYLASIKKNRVVILDLDDQLTSAKWHASRDVDDIDCVYEYTNIATTLKKLIRDYDHIIIDTQGRNSKTLHACISVADILLIPVRASQFNIDTMLTMSENVTIAQQRNAQLKARAVLNSCPTHHRSNEVADARLVMKDIMNIKLLNNVICDRKIYRDCESTGKSVIECSNIKASTEFNQFAKELTK
jgi:chromosome partitioning protein